MGDHNRSAHAARLPDRAAAIPEGFSEHQTIGQQRFIATVQPFYGDSGRIEHHSSDEGFLEILPRLPSDAGEQREDAIDFFSGAMLACDSFANARLISHRRVQCGCCIDGRTCNERWLRWTGHFLRPVHNKFAERRFKCDRRNGVGNGSRGEGE